MPLDTSLANDNFEMVMTFEDRTDERRVTEQLVMNKTWYQVFLSNIIIENVSFKIKDMFYLEYTLPANGSYIEIIYTMSDTRLKSLTIFVGKEGNQTDCPYVDNYIGKMKLLAIGQSANLTMPLYRNSVDNPDKFCVGFLPEMVNPNDTARRRRRKRQAVTEPKATESPTENENPTREDQTEDETPTDDKNQNNKEDQTEDINFDQLTVQQSISSVACARDGFTETEMTLWHYDCKVCMITTKFPTSCRWPTPSTTKSSVIAVGPHQNGSHLRFLLFHLQDNSILSILNRNLDVMLHFGVCCCFF